MRLPYVWEFWLSQFTLALQDSSVLMLLVIIGEVLTPSAIQQPMAFTTWHAVASHSVKFWPSCEVD